MQRSFPNVLKIRTADKLGAFSLLLVLFPSSLSCLETAIEQATFHSRISLLLPVTYELSHTTEMCITVRQGDCSASHCRGLAVISGGEQDADLGCPHQKGPRHPWADGKSSASS